MTRTEQNIALVSIILASAALPRSAICSKQPKGRVLLDGLYFPVQHGSKESCHAANLSVCCPGAVIWSCPLPHEPAERSFCCHVRHDCAYCCAEHEFFGQHDPAHCRDTDLTMLEIATRWSGNEKMHTGGISEESVDQPEEHIRTNIDNRAETTPAVQCGREVSVTVC
ncbi:uncharacterized protein LOC119110582 isoform X1 [Pollicipes pollicipes]|uniref:uncharacterized protein LOC119110582 isoform X1 n=1 Tax=Pollicipes pollicipes TaxID=41117 RepID=UPI00188503A6|nr:uncharacterized protein LOC119110582 isoform X1 [Pollicipes pollicipes]